MPRRSHRLIIVALWLGMMSWYGYREIVPGWGLGASPDYRTMPLHRYGDQTAEWQILRGNQPLGTAQTQVLGQPDGSSELRSIVRLSDVPLLPLLSGTNAGPSPMDVEAVFHVDSASNLQNFRITLRRQAERSGPIIVSGHVKASRLHVAFQSGTFREELAPIAYSPHGLMGSVLSPTDRLPPLRTGQSWRTTIVNPLTQGLATWRAEVERQETISWGPQRVECHLVRFEGEGITSRAWVRRDGVVLKQEVPLLWSTLTFVRMPEVEASGNGERARR